MPDLDPAHVEAVALVVDGCTESVWRTSDEHTRGPWKRAAERVLTSTDPAVHAALLAALVRADYLRRARELAEIASELATASGCSPQDALETMVRALTEVVEHAHD